MLGLSVEPSICCTKPTRPSSSSTRSDRMSALTCTPEKSRRSSSGERFPSLSASKSSCPDSDCSCDFLLRLLRFSPATTIMAAAMTPRPAFHTARLLSRSASQIGHGQPDLDLLFNYCMWDTRVLNEILPAHESHHSISLKVCMFSCASETQTHCTPSLLSQALLFLLVSHRLSYCIGKTMWKKGLTRRY